jgi:hypothetical protein
MQTLNLVDCSVVGRVERKGVPLITKMTETFLTAAGTFNYILTSNTISVPVCQCMIPMARRLNGSDYIYLCWQCNISWLIMENTLFKMSPLPINQVLMLMWAFAMGLGFQATFQPPVGGCFTYDNW